ncbi:unnamed protein product [Phytophthora fragariaefolia]|uniref:Unnamed protein product n=1 Tax=Phytophthora fragariaefolia TaxID=1490495 RepID=A0A9W6X061_9STRA|nr:unnamed protein product [Phytophthora fragariaefolia]
MRSSITWEFRVSLQSWINIFFKENGIPEATDFGIDAYIGLEIATGFNPVTEIKELLSHKLFMGQSDFALTMTRNRFESIPSHFQVHAPGGIPVERTIARSAAKTYLPSKPDKYGARFYAVVGREGLEDNSVWGNGVG